ncbi:DUF6286 domain-containing protein [Cellulomonas composti]|uniref:DUF6286 domain-containing protein n=1 Tax=Cellulomonas composti TaxID=266130 RepID=A0A511JA09_9CELL|nr:DUF6286 domain-containing protein [Cellulomonas composti]GEL94831.1 hypothetical protein CCO02nite_14890 [Cellulomonas composti]
MSIAPAPPATRAGRVGWVGVVLAALVVALGVLVIRDALVIDGRIDGSTWLVPLVDSTDGVEPSPALTAIGCVVALLGLWLVVVALGRRVRNRLPLDVPGASIGIADVARLAAAAAESVPYVLSAESSARRTSVKVTVTSLEGDDVADEVRALVEQRLARLATPMTVRVENRHVAGLR